MDRFLQRHNLLKLTQEEIKNLNRPITNKEIKLVIKKTSYQEKLRPGWLHWCSIKKIKIILIFHKIFQIIEEEETFPNTLYEADITMISKPEKNITKENKCKNYRSIFFININIKSLIQYQQTKSSKI